MAEMITGAEGLIKSLLAEGVDLVFGYPGGAIISVYDKLYDYQDKLHHILVRHEQGAVHAAQGYARISGRPGVVIVTSGPGAANVVTGLSDALMDSTPLVVISGQVASDNLGTDAFQEIDVVAMTQQITKWAIQIRRAEDIPAAVARAFYIASTGRPGPVVLDIAKDAQVGLMEWTHKTCEFIRSYNPEPEIELNDVQEVADLINNAQRPLIFSGHGVAIANAEKELYDLAEMGNIPVTATLLGLSTMDSYNPNYKGMLGMHGNIGPNIATDKADVILAIGMRFDDRVTGDTSKFAKNAKIIHVDIDSSELNKNVKVFKAINADAKAFLKDLLPLIKPNRHEDWNSLIDDCYMVEYSEVIKDEVSPKSGKMKMGEVVEFVTTAVRRGAICVTDVGQNQMFAARYFKFTAPKSFISSGGLGTMGFGLPAAIGAAMAAPDRTVCLFVGDGGLQMTIQELGTIMEHPVAVKIILLNNNFLGNVRQWQTLFFHSRYSQTQMLNPDFVALAGAYGIPGEDVTSRDDLPAAIDRMLSYDGTYLLNVDIDATDLIFPMIPAGGSVDNIILSPDKKFSF